MERISTKPALATPPPWVALFALQDIALLGYHLVLGALLRHAGGTMTGGMRWVIACALLVACVALFARGITEVPAKIRAGVYRLALPSVVIANYLMLREVLPAIRSDAVDGTLYRLDLALFGVEPALWLERFNTLPLVEYFSFFYSSYFAICFTYLLLSLFILRPGRATTEFALGTVLVYCVGQLGYIAVPAYGPVTALVDHFAGPVQGGFFWGCVRHAVAAGGAMKDVFPSLHTAAPVWFSLHAFERSRQERRLRPLAWVTAFFAVNIIVSTMFLRWHYAIDVLAGLVLAFTAGALVPRLVGWEEARRRRAGFGGAWSFM